MKINQKDIPRVLLQKFMIPSQFRTVEREQFELSYGAKELPIVIDLSDQTIEKLSFPVPKRKQIFAFATAQEKLLSRMGEIERIRIESIDAVYGCMLIINQGKDELYLITEAELIELLERCLRVPSQRVSKA